MKKSYEFKVEVWEMPEGWWAKVSDVPPELGIDVVGFGHSDPEQALIEVAEALSTNATVTMRKRFLEHGLSP